MRAFWHRRTDLAHNFVGLPQSFMHLGRTAVNMQASLGPEAYNRSLEKLRLCYILK